MISIIKNPIGKWRQFEGKLWVSILGCSYNLKNSSWQKIAYPVGEVFVMDKVARKVEAYEFKTESR